MSAIVETGTDLLFRLIREFESSYPDASVEATEFDFADPTARGSPTRKLTSR